MTGFKFRDLIPPGEAGRMAFRRELERRVRDWDKPVYMYTYKGGADLLLQHGTFWKGAPIRDEYSHLIGAESECFSNAWRAASNSDLRYVEGYYSIGDGMFMPHGWCITPDGDIQDVTVTDDAVGMTLARSRMVIPPQEYWSYWGAVFHVDLVEDHVENHGWDLPLLDRPKAELELQGTPRDGRPWEYWDFTVNHDFPILQFPYDPDRRAYP